MYGNKENMFKPDGISIKREDPGDDNDHPEYNIKTWDDLELDTNILRGIFAYGFENPSPIQQKAIYPILDKKAFKKWERRSDKAIKADKRQQKRVDDRDFRQERRRYRIEQTGGSHN